MLKYLLIIIFIVLGLNLTAQTDTISGIDTDSLTVSELFNIPFDKKDLSKIEIRNNLIEDSNITNFKNYFFLFLLNLFTIAVLLLEFSRTKVKKVLATLFNINMLKQFANVEMKRDNNYLSAYFLLLAIFIIVIIFVLSNLFEIEIDILKIGVSIVIFFIIDVLMDRVTSYVTKQKEPYSAVLFNNASFFILLLPVLIIGILLLIFLPEYLSRSFAYFFIVLVFGIYLWKEIRNIFILASSKIKVVSFYFFLYLCTFKILPFIILFKVISVEIIK